MVVFKSFCKVKALMSDNQIKEISTLVKCQGTYYEWHEYPCEMQYGSVCYSKQEEDLETAEAVYPDEYEPLIENIQIKNIIEILDKDVNWEVQDGWQYDNE